MSQSRVAILFSNIRQLELASLDIAHSASASNQRAVVTSLLFRDLVITDSRCVFPSFIRNIFVTIKYFWPAPGTS